MLSGILLSLQKGLLLSDNRDKPEDIVLNATSQSHEDKLRLRFHEVPRRARFTETGGRAVGARGRVRGHEGHSVGTKWQFGRTERVLRVVTNRCARA